MGQYLNTLDGQSKTEFRIWMPVEISFDTV